MEQLTLDQKVQKAVSLIQRAERLALSMNPIDGFWVGFSGGKDSLCVYQLAKMAGVLFTPTYCVTGIDAPESVRYIRENFPDVKFYHPPMKFIQLVAKKGMPTIGRQFCCERIKERISAGNTTLLGIRAQESRRRAKYDVISIASNRVEHRDKPHGRDDEWLQAVSHECIKGKDQVKILPIFDWTEEDVWEFIRQHNLPVNPMYETFGRVGCMFCPFASAAQVEVYEQKYPKFKAALLRAIEKNLEYRGEHPFKDAEQYYRWWKSKKSIASFLATDL